jgi:hypothetical protein
VEKVLKASVGIGNSIFQQIQKIEEIVVPGSIRYPLGGDSRVFSKHCSMDTGSEAGMTGFYCVLNNFGGTVLIFESTIIEFNKSE